jgi:hypothetical protein
MGNTSNQSKTTSTLDLGNEHLGQAGTPDDDGFMASVQKNLGRNREAMANSKKWFSVAANETVPLEFTGEFGPVKKDFDGDGKPEKILYEYHVKDRRYENPTVQLWDIAQSWANKVDKLLEAGHKLIEVSRTGSKKGDTHYTFKPLDTGFQGLMGAA